MENIQDRWAQRQLELRKRCVLQDSPDILEKLKDGSLLVCGLDISYSKDETMAYVGASLVRISDLSSGRQCETLAVHSVPASVTVPYVPNFLAFREVPAYMQALADFETSFGTADVLMVDSNGTLHPRKFGAACHLGVFLDRPTLGVAKNPPLLAAAPNSMPPEADTAAKQKDVLKQRMRGMKKGDYIRLCGEDGSVDGAAVLSGNSVNPIYVSPGHRVSLETAIEIALRCSIYRVPEPTRKADEISRTELQKMEAPFE